MRVYQSVAAAVRTREALELAQRLALWHDAMVIHRRQGGDEAGPSCEVDCPHEQAESLWLEALDVYGERAREFAFLRTFGGGPSRPPHLDRQELRCDRNGRRAGQPLHGVGRTSHAAVSWTDG